MKKLVAVFLALSFVMALATNDFYENTPLGTIEDNHYYEWRGRGHQCDGFLPDLIWWLTLPMLIRT